MYYPFFRGKQYELITVRDNAVLLKNAGFVPIIEPVRESLGGLKKTLEAVRDAEGEAIVIVNPHFGQHSGDKEVISTLLSDDLANHDSISPGVLLTEQVTLDEAEAMWSAHENRPVTLIHFGFADARALAERLSPKLTEMRHVFLEERCGKLYRRHFKDATRVLIRDGFQRRVNRDHPPVESFSDLHATFQEDGMNGFGDFLIVGNDYSETGGPAYAVVIHLTFIDPEKDDEMHIHHFKSIRQDTPKDPAGKFGEALAAMVGEIDRSGSHILETQAIQEFRELHKRGHFPGLGYVKKLSMKHHIETLADYFTKGK